jgi:hypothetical protein
MIWHQLGRVAVSSTAHVNDMESVRYDEFHPDCVRDAHFRVHILSKPLQGTIVLIVLC